jgi:hypothetical protein
MQKSQQVWAIWGMIQYLPGMGHCVPDVGHMGVGIVMQAAVSTDGGTKVSGFHSSTVH